VVHVALVGDHQATTVEHLVRVGWVDVADEPHAVALVAGRVTGNKAGALQVHVGEALGLLVADHACHPSTGSPNRSPTTATLVGLPSAMSPEVMVRSPGRCQPLVAEEP